MKGMKYWSFIGIIAVSLFCCAQSNSSQTVDANATKEAVVADSVPILVLRSWMNDREQITLEELKSLASHHQVFCTADINEILVKKWGVAAQTIIRNAFPFSSDSLYLLTTIDSVDGRWLSCKLNNISYFENHEQYPMFVSSTHPFRFEKEVTSYTHTGVTAITRQTGTVLNKIGMDAYLANILPYFKTPEYVHISNEVSAVDSCIYGQMKMSFATKTEHFGLIEKLGADIIELTGNHNLDFGKAPYLSTLKWYEARGMKYFGGGATPNQAKKPLIIALKDGTKIAWIGFNERCPCGECAEKSMGANRWDSLQAVHTIDSLRNQVGVNYIIGCAQFGETDSYAPTKSQKRISQLLMRMGVDVLIGSQAHQPQEVAIYQNKMIFYGIGNFMFDQVHRLGVRQAFFLQCYFYKGKIIQFQPVYTFMGPDRIPQIANAEEKKIIQASVLKSTNFPIKVDYSPSRK
jgi:poly-gamma-glutamate capsule biosynthesis protein CapA/YwtB (metallophosphatase superfamily)